MKLAKKIRTGSVAAFLAAICVATAPLPSYAEAKSVTISCSGYTGTTTLANFQALVKLAEGTGGFSYSDCEADGADLWFSYVDGNQITNVIPHEIDTWNSSGDSFVWVLLPELSPVAQGATTFTMHWGDLAAKQTTSVNVWKNYNDGKGGFVGVWHMGMASGTESEPDATSNGLDAIPTVNWGTGDLTVMKTTPGIVGNGRINQSSDAYVQGLKVPDYSNNLSDASKFTISGWWTATALNSYPRFASAEGSSRYWSIVGYANDGGNINRWQKIQGVYSSGVSTPAAFAVDSFNNAEGNWVYLTVVWNGTTLTVYSNGIQKYQKTDITAQTALDSGFMIGGNSGATSKNPAWRGYYDEVRMYDGAQTADRIKADYDTMSTPRTFLTFISNATAIWTGAANDGDGTNPQNWECSNNGVVAAGQLPDETYRIMSCALARDCDWSGLGTVYLADGAVIEMNGHSLTLPALSGLGTVQNSAAGDARELTLVLAQGWTNSGTTFGGNMKLDKTGEGVLTSSIAQSYSGGTEVRGGTIQAPQSTAAYNAAFTPFGTGAIIVNSNAVFHAQSTAAYTNSVILNGGTVRGGAGDGTKRPIVMLEKVTADSTVDQSVKAMEIGTSGVTTDLNGYTVFAKMYGATYFRWFGSLEGVNGKIVATGQGYFTEFPEEARGVDLDVSSKIHFQNETHVHDFRAANSNHSDATGAGLGIYVSGTYTPVGDYYYGCVMEDGSTLDLSGRTEVFSVKSSLSNATDSKLNTTAKKEARRTVQFAADATVTVNLAGRQDLRTIVVSESNYIVKWDETFGWPTTTKFKLDAETAQKFALGADATGLRLNKKSGMAIIFR